MQTNWTTEQLDAVADAVSRANVAKANFDGAAYAEAMREIFAITGQAHIYDEIKAA